MSFEQQLNLKFPIYWGGWIIGEEFARYLIYKIITDRPQNIVELGSGTSTLIMVKTLENLGIDYSLTSIDSDREFLDKTKNLLVAEGVYNEEKIKLVWAPLESISLGGNFYKWYKSKDIKFDFDKIDLLFIDGPFGGVCKNARYPALNVLEGYLKEGSLAILHDAKREDEKEIVEMWRRENSWIKTIAEIDTKRGGAEIQF